MLKKILANTLIASLLLLSVPAILLDVPVLSSSTAYASKMDQFIIDDSSVWYDRPNKMFGAAVTDTASGTYFTTTYRLDKINDNITYVMQSKNGAPFIQIGTIDWSRMSSASIGSPETGGPLFRFIADLAARKQGYNKMF